MTPSLSRASSLAPIALLAVLSGCGPEDIQTLHDGVGSGSAAGNPSGGTGGTLIGGDGGARSGVGGTQAGNGGAQSGVGGTLGTPSYVGNAILIFPERGQVDPGYIGFAFGTRNSWGINGPAFTFHDDVGSTISANIPDPTRVCVSGENVAVDLNCGGDCWAKYWGAGWGLNLNQQRNPAADDSNEPKPFDLLDDIIRFDVTGADVPNTLRILARAEGDDAIYCAPIVPGNNGIYTSQLVKNCWEGTANEPIDASKIWTIQFQIASMPYAIPFDFCVENLGVQAFVLR